MDYYQILGIGEKATEQDIKNAFRNLALSYHPDRVPEKNRKWAHEKFREISEAYATLIDKEKRTTYNRNHQKIFLTKQQREEMLDMLRKIQEMDEEIRKMKEETEKDREDSRVTTGEAILTMLWYVLPALICLTGLIIGGKIGHKVHGGKGTLIGLILGLAISGFFARKIFRFIGNMTIKIYYPFMQKHKSKRLL